MNQTGRLLSRVALSLLLAGLAAALQPRVITGGDPLAWLLSLAGSIAAALLVAGVAAVLLRHSHPARVATSFVVALWSALLLALLFAWTPGFSADPACERRLAQVSAPAAPEAGGCPDDSPPDDAELVQFASLTPDEGELGTHVAVLVRRIHEGRAARDMSLPVERKPAPLTAREAAAIRGASLAAYDPEDFLLRYGYGAARKGARGHLYYAAVHRQSPAVLALYEASVAALGRDEQAQSMCELLRRGIAQQLKQELRAAPEVAVASAGQEQEVTACAMRYQGRASGAVLAYAAWNESTLYIVYLRAQRDGPGAAGRLGRGVSG